MTNPLEDKAQTKAIFVKAKELLKEENWYPKRKQELSTSEGCFCAATAICEATRKVTGDYYATTKCYLELFTELNSIPNPNDYTLEGIPRWNDAAERTFQDVTNAFDKVIASLDL